jgi:hypothetical protein
MIGAPQVWCALNELQELDIAIHPDGPVQVEVRGVKGPKCLD